MKQIFFVLVTLGIAGTGQGQIRDILINSKARVFSKVQQKIDERIDRTIDSAVDGQKKKKKNKGDNEKVSGEGNESNKNAQVNTDDQNQVDAEDQKNASTALITYRKFDFIPGAKVQSYETFTNTPLGDFPDKWNTNSTGEIVTIDGLEGKWMMLQKDGVFHPEFITSLPENFTFEFELVCNREFSFYSTPFYLDFVLLKNKNNFTDWKQFMNANRNGIEIMFHPTNADASAGSTEYSVFENGASVMKNQTYTNQFHALTNNYAKISVSRQKQRIRVYLNEEKVWDVPKALSPNMQYNSILFALGASRNTSDRYFISNLKLAVGAPDTRNKLITEGKFITSGILFDINSDQIRSDSYGALKDIAAVLTENPDVKVKIVGHTDSDGDEQANLNLSKKRAEAVKLALNKEFGIDLSRMSSDGKGESEPADNNNSLEGKANNRRVEFIKVN